MYLRGRLWAPVPLLNILNFPHLMKKVPNQKINLVVFNNYSIFFHLDVLSFNFKSDDIKIYMTTVKPVLVATSIKQATCI